MSTQKTHLVVKAGSTGTGDTKQQLQLRAARFGIDKGVSPAASNRSAKKSSNPTPSIPTDPIEAEKFAKRASRFADVHKNNAGALPVLSKSDIAAGGKIKTISTPVATSNDPAEAERLAKRAARFADIPRK